MDVYPYGLIDPDTFFATFGYIWNDTEKCWRKQRIKPRDVARVAFDYTVGLLIPRNDTAVIQAFGDSFRNSITAAIGTERRDSWHAK